MKMPWSRSPVDHAKVAQEMVNEEKRDRWDRYFIDLCLLNASMSKDPSTKVGAVVVGPDLEVRATGFNGFARGIKDSDERLHDRDTKLANIIHAEMNAIVSAAMVGVSLNGCSLFMAAIDMQSGKVWGGAPCSGVCTPHIINVGIKEVVTLPMSLTPPRWRGAVFTARQRFAEAGVTLRDTTPKSALGDAIVQWTKGVKGEAA